MVYAPPPVQQPVVADRRIELQEWQPDKQYHYDPLNHFVIKPQGSDMYVIGYSDDGKSHRLLQPNERTMALNLGYKTAEQPMPQVANSTPFVPPQQPQVPVGLNIQAMMQAGGQGSGNALV